MRIFTHLVVAFLLLVLLGALWRVTPFEVVIPDVALVYALYLGVTARSYLWEATLGVLAIGYVADILAGAPRGLSSLVLGGVCILSRLVSTRLLLRGNLFVGVFAFVWATVAGIAMLVLRASFHAGVGPVGRSIFFVGATALFTAVCAPVVFRVCRSVDARFARTQREREAMKDGYIG